MMKARTGRTSIPAFLIMACLVFSACVKPQESQEADKEEPKREYRDIKPEVFPIPEEISGALPGLLNDNFYLYREISPTLNLVTYVPDYSLERAINMAAEAFTHMLKEPKFKEGVDFWIIQIQPEPGKGGQVMVWGVRPSEVEEYAGTGDLAAFFRDSEYALIDDSIIPAGDERAKHWPGEKEPAAQQGEK